MEIVGIVIGSSLIAAIVSGLINMYQANIDYRNEYYKKIIEKRFQSYELIERLLYFFSTAVTDNTDKEMYHVIFGEKDNPFISEYALIITKLSKSNIWLSDEVTDELNKLNYFIIENDIKFDNIQHGKKFYPELGNIRNDILDIVKKDVLKLHKIKKELKREVKTGVVKVKVPIKRTST